MPKRYAVWDEEDGSEVDLWCIQLAATFLPNQVGDFLMYDVVVLAERIRAALDGFISTGFHDDEYEKAPDYVKSYVARQWDGEGPAALLGDRAPSDVRCESAQPVGEPPPEADQRATGD